MKDEDVVGAMAIVVAFLMPVPRSTSGSPYLSAAHLDAAYVLSRMNCHISTLSFLASTDSNGIIFDCRSECHPRTPMPMARCLSANLVAFSMNGMFRVLMMYSSMTASRNNVRLNMTSES